MNPHFVSSSSWASITNLNYFFIFIIILVTFNKTSTSLTYLVFSFVFGLNHYWFSPALNFVSTTTILTALGNIITCSCIYGKHTSSLSRLDNSSRWFSNLDIHSETTFLLSSFTIWKMNSHRQAIHFTKSLDYDITQIDSLFTPAELDTSAALGMPFLSNLLLAGFESVTSNSPWLNIVSG